MLVVCSESAPNGCGFPCSKAESSGGALTVFWRSVALLANGFLAVVRPCGRGLGHMGGDTKVGGEGIPWHMKIHNRLPTTRRLARKQSARRGTYALVALLSVELALYGRYGKSSVWFQPTTAAVRRESNEWSETGKTANAHTKLGTSHTPTLSLSGHPEHTGSQVCTYLHIRALEHSLTPILSRTSHCGTALFASGHLCS